MSDNTSGWEASLKPVLDISEVNRQALERVTALQTKCLGDLLEANMKQMQAVIGSNPQALGTLQMDYYREMEAKVQETAEKELSALAEAREAITKIMEESYQHHRRFFTELYPNPDTL
ncbi:phasin family protein [Motiliproteus sp. SC1-56]|uniref:phasin family protein n=1 Tax=Motiliproteus sp. SC1-56 TaxID=2799565 RepID=UPI001A8C33B4|nr:phasin family protein [Motiliproteus sp. SC1-56]